MKQRRDDGGRGDLTDEQWVKLKPLLPPQKAHTGQPAHDHRRIFKMTPFEQVRLVHQRVPVASGIRHSEHLYQTIASFCNRTLLAAVRAECDFLNLSEMRACRSHVILLLLGLMDGQTNLKARVARL